MYIRNSSDLSRQKHLIAGIEPLPSGRVSLLTWECVPDVIFAFRNSPHVAKTRRPRYMFVRQRQE